MFVFKNISLVSFLLITSLVFSSACGKKSKKASVRSPASVSNLSPSCEGIDDKVLLEGDSLSNIEIFISCFDPENESLSYFLTSSPDLESLFINPSTGEISGELGYFDAGSYAVKITASDGVQVGSAEFNLIVENVNRPPVLTVASEKVFSEGNEISFSAEAFDPDEQVVRFSLQNAPEFLQINEQTGALSGSASLSDANEYNFTVIAHDDDPASPLTDSKPVKLIITNTNQDPILSPVGSKSVQQGELLEIPLSGSDADNDTLTFEAQGLPSGASFNATTKKFSWVPRFDQIGQFSMTFEVQDSSGAKGTELVSITVNETCLFANGLEEKSGKENELINFSVACASPSSIVSYSSSDLPQEATLSPQGMFSWTPNFNQSGQASFTVTASSIADSNVTQSRQVVIEVSDTNQAPTLSEILPQTMDEDGEHVVTLNVSDPDDESLDCNSLTLISSSSEVNITKGGVAPACTLTLKPSANFYGSSEITVTASDGALSAARTFQLTIKAVDDPPVASDVNGTLEEDVPGVVVLSYSDVEDHKASSCEILNPQNISGSCTCSEGVCSANVVGDSDFVGSSRFDYRVVTNGVQSNVAAATVIINGVNDAPVCNSISDQTIAEGADISSLGNLVSCSDPDGDTLSYSMTGHPNSTGINNSTGSITGNLTYDDAGEYNITVTAFDGSLNKTLSFKLNVSENYLCDFNIADEVITVPIALEYETADGNRYSRVDMVVSDPECNTTSKVILPQGFPTTILNPVFSPDAAGEKGRYYGESNILRAAVDVSQMTFYLRPDPGARLTGTDSGGDNLKRVTVKFAAAPTLNYGDLEINGILGSSLSISPTVLKTNNASITSCMTQPDLPPGLSIDPTNCEISGTPSGLTCPMDQDFTIIATNEAGSTQATLSLNIEVANISPQFAFPTPNLNSQTSGVEGATMLINISATDSCQDQLTYSIENSSLIPWCSIDSSSGQITCSPGFDLVEHSGSDQYNLIVGVSDGDLKITHSIELTVANKNRLPLVSSSYTGITQLKEEEDIFSYTFSASDEDQYDSVLSFSCRVIKDGVETLCNQLMDTETSQDGSGYLMRFSPTISFTDVDSQVQIIFTVQDSLNTVVEEVINLSIINRPNQAPVLSSIEDKKVNPNETISFQLTASDPDSEDSLSFSYTTLPAGSSFNGSTFTWTPRYDQVGEHSITFTVSDNGEPKLHASRKVLITVNEVEIGPELNCVGQGFSGTVPNGLQEVRLTIGNKDYFSGEEDGGEFAPSQEYLQLIQDHYGNGQFYALFDSPVYNSFRIAEIDLVEYKGRISCLSTKIVAKGSGSVNDTFVFWAGPYGKGGAQVSTLNDFVNLPSVASFGGELHAKQSSWSEGHFMVDISHLTDHVDSKGHNFLETLNQQGVLKFRYQDDSMVDYVELVMYVEPAPFIEVSQLSSQRLSFINCGTSGERLKASIVDCASKNNGATVHVGNDKFWKLVNRSGADEVWLDEKSGLVWSTNIGKLDYTSAQNNCSNLSYGINGEAWYLPGREEVLTSHENGFVGLITSGTWDYFRSTYDYYGCPETYTLHGMKWSCTSPTNLRSTRCVYSSR